MSETGAFKDYYNVELAASMATEVAEVYPEFRKENFMDAICREVEHLEFKDRIRLFSRALKLCLPGDFGDAWRILEKLLPDELEETDGIFNDGFALWPVAQYIEDCGLDHFDLAMEAMHEITKRHTAEFAIRPFLIRYPEKTLEVLGRWVDDPNPHVRRLVSEGTRPRLPWAARLEQFVADPAPTLGLLERLKDDPSEYVRRSVANHLNDICKDHPELILSILEKWSDGASEGTLWIIKHALRNMVKAGNLRALAILGFGPPQITLKDISVAPPRIALGESIEISFTLQSTSAVSQNLVIDYIVHFVKANGKRSPKVFKLRTTQLDPGGQVEITRRHAVRPITTRVYYGGTHRVEIQVNGQVFGGVDFDLDV